MCCRCDKIIKTSIVQTLEEEVLWLQKKTLTFVLLASIFGVLLPDDDLCCKKQEKFFIASKKQKISLWKPINTKSRLINRFSATLSHAVRFNTACAVQCTQHPGRTLMIYAKIVTKRSLTTFQRFLCQLTIGHRVIHSIWRFFCNHKHFCHIWHFCMIWNILKLFLTRDFVIRGNFSWFFKIELCLIHTLKKKTFWLFW